jgi:hypothetical protein
MRKVVQTESDKSDGGSSLHFSVHLSTVFLKNTHIHGRTVNCIYGRVKSLVGGTIYRFLIWVLKIVVNKRLLYNDK